MTFELVSAVKVLPPQAWIQALKQRVELEQQDERQKAEWWILARRAATILREQFGMQRVGVIGDLVCPQPLNYWSEINLVVWGMDGRSDLDIYKALSEVSEEPKIRLLDTEKDYLMVDEEAIEQDMVEIEIS